MPDISQRLDCVKVDGQCLVKIFGASPKLAGFIAVEIFFPQPATSLFQAVIAARRSDSRFSQLLYSRGVEFIPQRISTDTPRTWRKLSLLFRAAIRISIKSRLFHIFISCIFIGSTYCISMILQSH